LAPLVVCAGCPVRRECLRASFDVFEYERFEESSESTRAKPSALMSEGIWGGAFEHERKETAHLSSDHVVDLLERTFPHRLEIRRRAWWRRLPDRVIHPVDRFIAQQLGVELPAP
jgi:hypothetical protein